jgi:putative DNA primase/helicase
VGNGEAAKSLAAQLGVGVEKQSPAAPAAAKESAKPRTEWRPIVPAPRDAGPPPLAHIKRGRPELSWRYIDQLGELLGVVYRFRTSDGGKEVLPCVYAEGPNGVREWRWLSWPEPRPLYGLLELAHATERSTVLIVEGEKCTDAARALLGDSALVVCSWPGGGKAVGKVDWSPLARRRVVIWPDCDAQIANERNAERYGVKVGEFIPEPEQPGVHAAEAIAAQLLELDCTVRIVKIPAPGAKPNGWDVADAIAEGWTRDQVLAFIRDNLRPCAAAASARDDQAAPQQLSEAEGWRSQLVRGGNGALIACVPNAFMVLTNRQEWRGVLAFDEFASRPVKRMPPPYERGVAGEWEEIDDSFSALWLATRAGLARVSSAMAAEAAEMAARTQPFDPVRAFLEGLTWDGVPRLDHWLADYFGAHQSPYTALVGRFWLLGMVRRVFEPGCKFDYMPILEGPQGRGKSTALELLAYPWFGNTDFVMGDKDSMAVMQGKWLYEVAELDSFNKADTTRVKSFVTRTVDEFRPAYGRRILKLPRRVVLVGTTNQLEYFKDGTGNRRFWPVQCREQINLEGLRAHREQLFAEAVVRCRERERCYPTREEQEAYFTPEQDSREIADAWEDGIYRYLERKDEVNGLPEIHETSGYDVLTLGLKIDAGKITKEMTTRLGLIMRKLGWHKVEKRNSHPRYVYERPTKSALDDSAGSAATAPESSARSVDADRGVPM